MNNLPTLKGTCLLASVLLSACQTDTERQSEGREVSITFNAHIHGEPAECGVRYSDLGSSAIGAELRNLKWFVSNVELISEDGSSHPLTLSEQPPWQSTHAALIDLEDGSGACSESGDEQMNAVITGVTSAPDIAGVRFEVGVPQEVNHLDLAEALPPLDRSDMFWAWQSGHKFARVEWSVGEEGSASPWNFHLGSTGCMSEGATVAPAEACANPNRPSITLMGVDSDAPQVTLDLSSLFQDVDLTQNTPDTPMGCSSMPSEPEDCAPLFEALMLSDSPCEGRVVV